MKDPANLLATVFAGISLSFIAHAADKPAQTLRVTNGSAAKFTVIYHRANPTGAGAVAGGLIGAAIQSGIQGGQDDNMAKKILEANPDMTCDKPLMDAMRSKLQASSYELDDVAGQVPVDISIEECGLRLADSNALQLTAYVNVTLKVLQPGAKPWIEQIQISGRNRYSYDEFAQQKGLASTEVTEVLKRAGVRAADKFIYRR